MEFKEKLRRLRRNKLLTQRALSEMIGISETSIKSWESGYKSPSMAGIIALSKALDVSADYLLGISADAESIDNLLLSPSEKNLLSDYRLLDSYGQKAVETICALEKTRVEDTRNKQKITEVYSVSSGSAERYIPKYNTSIAAGYSAPLDECDYELIPFDSSMPAEADFAVTVHGDSMYPYIYDGELIYVKKTCELAIGDVGVFCVNGAMYCKQYYIDGFRNLTLVSANPALRDSNVYVAAESSSDVTCYGKVLLKNNFGLPKYFTSEINSH